MGQVSLDQRIVTVSLCPDTSVARVCIGGAIDLAATAALDHAAEQLRIAAYRTVLVDAAAVTFACSTLINFLAQVRKAMPQDAELVISRAPAPTRRLLALTGLDSVIVMDDARSFAV